VYVEVSAGSMIFSRNLGERSVDVMGDVADLHVLGVTTVDPPFELFGWYLKSHLYSPDFPERTDAWADRIAARADFPVYFIDDETASTSTATRWTSSPRAGGGFTRSSPG
jgi:dipeptidase E